MRNVILSFTILLAACGNEYAADETSPCQVAADHVAACAGDDPAPAQASCDAAEAERLASLSCNEIMGGLEDAKADRLGLRRAACRWGIYRYCPVPSCDPEADEDTPMLSAMPEGSACLDEVRDLEGCGVCDYYRCREAEMNCGEDGYLMAFAEKYCVRYRQVTERDVSPEAQAWLNRIRRCLVVTLEDAPTDSCEALSDFGFASHSACYVQTGFCALSPRDWLAVLNTVDVRDTQLRAMLTTGVACLREWLGD